METWKSNTFASYLEDDDVFANAVDEVVKEQKSLENSQGRDGQGFRFHDTPRSGIGKSTFSTGTLKGVLPSDLESEGGDSLDREDITYDINAKTIPTNDAKQSLQRSSFLSTNTDVRRGHRRDLSVASDRTDMSRMMSQNEAHRRPESRAGSRPQSRYGSPTSVGLLNSGDAVNIQATNSNLKHRNEHLMQRMKFMENAMQKLEGEREELLNQLDMHKNDIEELDGTVEKMKKEARIEKEKYLERVKNISNQLEAQKKKNEDTKARISELITEKDFLKTNIQDLETENENIKKKSAEASHLVATRRRGSSRTPQRRRSRMRSPAQISTKNLGRGSFTAADMSPRANPMVIPAENLQYAMLEPEQAKRAEMLAKRLKELEENNRLLREEKEAAQKTADDAIKAAKHAALKGRVEETKEDMSNPIIEALEIQLKKIEEREKAMKREMEEKLRQANIEAKEAKEQALKYKGEVDNKKQSLLELKKTNLALQKQFEEAKALIDTKEAEGESSKSKLLESLRRLKEKQLNLIYENEKNLKKAEERAERAIRRAKELEMEAIRAKKQKEKLQQSLTLTESQAQMAREQAKKAADEAIMAKRKADEAITAKRKAKKAADEAIVARRKMQSAGRHSPAAGSRELEYPRGDIPAGDIGLSSQSLSEKYPGYNNLSQEEKAKLVLQEEMVTRNNWNWQLGQDDTQFGIHLAQEAVTFLAEAREKDSKDLEEFMISDSHLREKKSFRDAEDERSCRGACRGGFVSFVSNIFTSQSLRKTTNVKGAHRDTNDYDPQDSLLVSSTEN
ncbi:hypothetical protein AAMO2058_000260700 [Amorphochlora amoebiformis]